MDIVLFDNHPGRTNLYPLTFTRPIADLRVGILTIAQKWEKWLQMPVSFLTADYLSRKYPLNFTGSDVLFIDGSICPDTQLIDAVLNLQIGEVLMNESFIAIRTSATDAHEFQSEKIAGNHQIVHYPGHFTQIKYPEDIFMYNGEQIRRDFELLTKGRVSASLDASNRIIGDAIFVEEGAKATAATINTTDGPVYIGKDAEIWEGCLVRGPFALCEGAQLKMGTKIYSNVTVGPNSRVGGELNTCVIWGNSSKGHDGYFGSGVMGEWCNWGADTNNSNLKNNYKNVRLYHYGSRKFRDTGLQFCGLIMADHARCAINTAFNTGTIVGVGASIFGVGMPPTYIPDFTWGGADGFLVYNLEKLFETSALVFERRNRTFDTMEMHILKSVFDLTAEWRAL